MSIDRKYILIDCATLLEVRTIIQMTETFSSKVAGRARAEDDQDLADEAWKLETLCFASAAELQEQCANWLKRYDENG